MAKITSIVENENFDMDNAYSNFAGFIVSLDNGKKLHLGIQNQQCCCEHWGYFMSQDTFEDFLGADFLKVSVVDDALKVYEVLGNDPYEERAVMFVNIETSVGLLQFVAYNEHNGYYGHEARVWFDGNLEASTFL